MGYSSYEALRLIIIGEFNITKSEYKKLEAGVKHVLFEQYREQREKTEEVLDDLWDYLKDKLYLGSDTEWSPRKSETLKSVKDSIAEEAASKEAA